MEKIVISAAEVAETVPLPEGPARLGPRLPSPVSWWAKLTMWPLALVLPLLCVIAITHNNGSTSARGHIVNFAHQETGEGSRGPNRAGPSGSGTVSATSAALITIFSIGRVARGN